MKVSNPMPYFDIHTTNAQIHVKSEPLRLKVESEPARMRVRRTRPKMKVNWKKVQEQCGLKSPAAQRRYMQRMYRQKALDGISRVGSEYDKIGDMQNYAADGPEIVATVALDTVMKQDVPVVDVASMPSSMPEVEWEPGELEIEWEPAKLEMHWEGSIRPEITITPHTVEIRLINGETIRVGENEARDLERQGYGKRLDKKI